MHTKRAILLAMMSLAGGWGCGGERTGGRLDGGEQAPIAGAGAASSPEAPSTDRTARIEQVELQRTALREARLARREERMAARGGPPSSPVSRASLEADAIRTQVTLPSLPATGIRLEDVREPSVVAAAGVRSGDILLGVERTPRAEGGVRALQPAELVRAFVEVWEDGAPFVLRMEREGAPMELAVDPKASRLRALEEQERVRARLDALRPEPSEGGAAAAELRRGFRAVPNYVDGEQRGLRLFALRRSSRVRAAGLENDDILRAVDGERLEPEALHERLRSSLLGTTPFTLRVERGDRTLDITIDPDALRR